MLLTYTRPLMQVIGYSVFVGTKTSYLYVTLFYTLQFKILLFRNLILTYHYFNFFPLTKISAIENFLKHFA